MSYTNENKYQGLLIFLQCNSAVHISRKVKIYSKTKNCSKSHSLTYFAWESHVHTCVSRFCMIVLFVFFVLMSTTEEHVCHVLFLNQHVNI